MVCTFNEKLLKVALREFCTNYLKADAPVLGTTDEAYKQMQKPHPQIITTHSEVVTLSNNMVGKYQCLLAIYIQRIATHAEKR